ncbi:hypothetical protein COHA_008402 [Chlorella ohadii]|uniref:Uncharacterized protein n=1 Tax=Chlorella ohadii TaxID=2649997 RepID=A0AAD5DK84_9CHLO|nr:hypothetical protein COHA_008402 [Chlorella ohadii]
MSGIQRWRAFKFAVKEWAERMSHVPAIAAVLAALAAVRRQLQPLYDAAAWAEKQWADLLLLYNAFVAEETKRLWHWSRRFPKEAEVWSAVPQFMGYFILTVFYQSLMPLSVAAALMVPLWYSWVMWDNWWASPVFLATLATAPLKWVPWADKCWLWPGLI